MNFTILRNNKMNKQKAFTRFIDTLPLLTRVKLFFRRRYCSNCHRWAPRFSNGYCSLCGPMPEGLRRAIADTMREMGVE